MTAATFELRRLDSGGAGRTVPVVRLTGEIDATNAPELERTLVEVVASSPAVIDLSALTYFDSAGFRVLDQVLGPDAAVAVVISPASVLRAAASLVGVPFHDDVAHARAALATRS